MIVVKPLKSYRIIDKVMPIQNAGKPLREQLRSAHKQLFKALIRLLNKEILRVQRFGGTGSREERLHKVRTNRKNLAAMLNMGEKTVYNLLTRLSDFGWVSKVWHGSNASFEVEINPSLVYVEDDTLPHPGNVADRFTSDLPPFRQTLPHTLPGVPWDTNKSNKQSGLSDDDTEAASPASAPVADTPKRRDTDSGYHPGSAAPTTPVAAPQVAQVTEVPAAKKPKTLAEVKELVPVLPRTMDEVLQLVEPKHRVWLVQHVDHVFEYALAELAQWFPAWIAPSVREKSRIALAEYFAYGNPKHWKRAMVEFTARIDMVCGYLERRQQDPNQQAWLPLPHVWFDLRTRRAFADTKMWKARNEDPKVVWGRAEVQRAIIDYWRALESKRIDKDQALFKIKQRLEKRGGPLLFQQFQNQFKTSYAARRGVA